VPGGYFDVKTSLRPSFASVRFCVRPLLPCRLRAASVTKSAHPRKTRRGVQSIGQYGWNLRDLPSRRCRPIGLSTTEVVSLWAPRARCRLESCVHRWAACNRPSTRRAGVPRRPSGSVRRRPRASGNDSLAQQTLPPGEQHDFADVGSDFAGLWSDPLAQGIDLADVRGGGCGRANRSTRVARSLRRGGNSFCAPGERSAPRGNRFARPAERLDRTCDDGWSRRGACCSAAKLIHTPAKSIHGGRERVHAPAKSIYTRRREGRHRSEEGASAAKSSH
jgi:hypothetical protein